MSSGQHSPRWYTRRRGGYPIPGLHTDDVAARMGELTREMERFAAAAALSFLPAPITPHAARASSAASPLQPSTSAETRRRRNGKRRGIMLTSDPVVRSCGSAGGRLKIETNAAFSSSNPILPRGARPMARSQPRPILLLICPTFPAAGSCSVICLRRIYNF